MVTNVGGLEAGGPELFGDLGREVRVDEQPSRGRGHGEFRGRRAGESWPRGRGSADPPRVSRYGRLEPCAAATSTAFSLAPRRCRPGPADAG